MSEFFSSNFRKGQEIWNGWLIRSIPVSDYGKNLIFFLFLFRFSEEKNSSPILCLYKAPLLCPAEVTNG
jgi:hypothetical protein